MQWKNCIKNLTFYFNCIEQKCIKYVIFTDNTGISLVTFKARPIFAVKPWKVLLSRQLTLTGNLWGPSFRPLSLSRPLFWLPWPRGRPWDSPAWGQYLIVGLHFPAFFCLHYKHIPCQFKGTVSRDGYFFEGLNILVSTLCVWSFLSASFHLLCTYSKNNKPWIQIANVLTTCYILIFLSAGRKVIYMFKKYSVHVVHYFRTLAKLPLWKF